MGGGRGRAGSREEGSVQGSQPGGWSHRSSSGARPGGQDRHRLLPPPPASTSCQLAKPPASPAWHPAPPHHQPAWASPGRAPGSHQAATLALVSLCMELSSREQSWGLACRVCSGHDTHARRREGKGGPGTALGTRGGVPLSGKEGRCWERKIQRDSRWQTDRQMDGPAQWREQPQPEQGSTLYATRAGHRFPSPRGGGMCFSISNMSL